MKKSEFILDLRHEGLGAAWANRIAVKVKEAGVSWDPEEPELPERIYSHHQSLRVVGSKLQPCSAKEYREAAACYNLVRRTRIHDAPDREVYHWELLRTWLQEEREKLR